MHKPSYYEVVKTSNCLCKKMLAVLVMLVEPVVMLVEPVAIVADKK